jgi:hypothetical protein
MKKNYATIIVKFIQITFLAVILNLYMPGTGAAQHQTSTINKFIDRATDSKQLLYRSDVLNSTTSTHNLRAVRATTSRVLPHRSKDFISSSDGSWEHTGFTEYTYTSSGQNLAILNKSASNENMFTYTFSYDVHGNHTEILYKEWKNGSWVIVDGNKYLYSYNTDGKITQRTFQIYSSDAWENHSRTANTYDASGRLTEMVNSLFSDNDWVIHERERSTYSGTSVFPDIVLHQYYQFGNWTDGTRSTDFSRNSEGEPLEYIQQSSRNGEWHNDSKHTFSYDGFGGYIETVENFKEGNWVNEKRTTDLKDQNSFDIEYKHEIWDNNVWNLRNQTLFVISYDADGELAERITKYLDTNSGTLVNIEKSEFGNVPTAVSSREVKMAVNVYPNPAQSIVAIESDFSEATQLQLTDLTGKIVATKTIAAGAAPLQHIELSAQAAGVYVLTLKNSKASFTSRLVKQ